MVGVKVLQGDEQQIEGDLVLKEEKMYMLKNEELRIEMIWLQHNILVTEHRRRQKTTKLVTRNIRKYVDRCNICQRIKNQTEVLAERSRLSEVLEKLQMYLIVNFIIKLPLVAEKNAILVVCNRLSKMTYFVATLERITVQELVRLFRDNIQK